MNLAGATSGFGLRATPGTRTIDGELRAPKRRMLLPLHPCGVDRAIRLAGALDVDSVAALERGARHVREFGGRARQDLESVHAEADRRTRSSQATQRSLDLELTTFFVIIDLDLARAQRSVTLARADDVERLTSL